MGFGARIVFGYRYDPHRSAVGSSSAGWIMFDPSRSVGRFNLSPVAVARHIRQTMPVSGSFIGDAAAFETLDVVATVAPASA